MSITTHLTVIGGGLAGCEAAWQAARQGAEVELFEMRPLQMTEAHKTELLAELVCSNSLRSKDLTTGAGLLKEELRLAGSLVISSAYATEVPAGSALAVDRSLFSARVTEAISTHPRIKVVREEVTALPEHGLAVIATGPLTSGPLVREIAALIGEEHLFFYDAIAPIVSADSVDLSKTYHASRYDKGGEDYLNCPLSKDEYDRFYNALIEADSVAPRGFEDTKVFEACMPIEVMARRGRDTLRYGPLRPVGLRDPRSGGVAFAVVQLRPENRDKTAYNLVGFQTRLTWSEQKRVLRMIPGLEGAEFLRFGSVHRNTFIHGPRHLREDLSLKERDTLYFAGQITGVEGYIESTAMGLLAGMNAARRIRGVPALLPPRETAHGSLVHHVTQSDSRPFQPSNMNFGLLPADDEAMRIRDKRLRRERMAENALGKWRQYAAEAVGEE
jgi:methylenetetrahydrofolate--tRNA-(uracil-5-)-methyltransferase